MPAASAARGVARDAVGQDRRPDSLKEELDVGEALIGRVGAFLRDHLADSDAQRLQRVAGAHRPVAVDVAAIDVALLDPDRGLQHSERVDRADGAVVVEVGAGAGGVACGRNEQDESDEGRESFA